MNIESLKARKLDDEFVFTASRSSGPGGQNVNKVNTRAEIRFSVADSAVLSDSEKDLIFWKLSRKINSSGELIVTSQSERSQLKNRERATEKMLLLLAGSLTEVPKRKRTSPSVKSKLERLEEKHRKGRIKALRKDSDEGPE
ncbi:MAG: alternative ribosome rescue aminoacyl-tRNA hydrolase ArfB [Bacteroidales bacterium]